jgi:DNA-nicking Smr family endonuclease
MPRKAKRAAKAAEAKAKARPAQSWPGAFYRPFAALERQTERSGSGNERPAPVTPAPPPAAARRDPPRSPDAGGDADTFAIYMAGVETLEPRATRIPRTASEVERPSRSLPVGDADAPARASLGSLVTDGIRFEVSDDGERLEGRRIDVDPRELRRLRRGEYPVDGRLDLHGMTVDEARRALEAFVRKRRADGDRLVVVVHGKGRHSPRGDAVLRGEIGAWLSQGRAAREVDAFASVGAVRVDPGAGDDAERPGALYVLLAR